MRARVTHAGCCHLVSWIRGRWAVGCGDAFMDCITAFEACFPHLLPTTHNWSRPIATQPSQERNVKPATLQPVVSVSVDAWVCVSFVYTKSHYQSLLGVCGQTQRASERSEVLPFHPPLMLWKYWFRWNLKDGNPVGWKLEQTKAREQRISWSHRIIQSTELKCSNI